jgi:phosphonate transport system substrate-binding protein
MAPNAEPLFEDTVLYLASRSGIEAQIAHAVDWVQRERELDRGQTEVGWICGLPYVWKADQPGSKLELLAAPVMSSPRYQDQPVYFSDVMVSSESPFKEFEDLKHARCAYNEPRSHSGYNVVKAHLYDLGINEGFFNSVQMAGSHENALDMILSGEVDAAAIDTTVYETHLIKKPEIKPRLRVIATLGPSPIPPWVISTEVDAELRHKMCGTLTQMHKDPVGAKILGRHAVARYLAVDDSFYNPIRDMHRKAQQVKLTDEAI